MRRKSPPHHLARKAETVEKLRVVAGDPARKDGGFPGARGNLIPLELPDHGQRAIHAVQLSAARDVLPAGQETHEIGGRGRLDLPAQPAESQAVNPGQEAPVGPFRLAGPPGGELPPQDLPSRFEARQPAFDQPQWQRQKLAQRRAFRRPGGFEPAAKNLRDRGFLRGRVRPVSQFQALGSNPELAARCYQNGGAARPFQLLEQFRPLGGRWERHQRQQRVVQLIGIAHLRPRFRRHLRDGLGIERPGVRGKLGRERTAQLHRAGTAFLKRRVIEKRVRVRVEDLVREGRWLGGIDGHRAERPGLDLSEQGFQPVQVHGLAQAVRNGLLDEGMIGDANLALQVFGAGGLVRENRGQQIVGPHALDRRGHLAASGKAKNRQRAGNVPAPSRREHRGIEKRLGERVLHGLRIQELEDRLQRKRVLLGERDDDPVVGSRGLQLEVEGAAEALAQRQPPGAIDTRSEGSVQHQLHAAGFVEKPLGDQRLCRWQRVQCLPTRVHVGGRLAGPGPIQTALGH